MPNLRHSALILLSSAALLTACSTAGPNAAPIDNGQTLDDLTDVDIPEAFDYATTRTLQLELSATGEIAEPLGFALVNVYADDSSEAMFKALTDVQGKLSNALTVPSHVASLRVELDYAGDKQEKVIDLGQNNQLSVSFSQQAASLHTASNDTSFGTCPSIGFLFQNSTVDAYGVSLATGATPLLKEDVQRTTGGTAKYNAVGFNVLDNYIYGAMNGDKNGTIGRLGSDYELTVLGPIAGLPHVSFYVGDVSSDGKLYLSQANSSKFYVIDVDSNSDSYLDLVATRSLSSKIKVYDWGFNPLDNQLYAVQNDKNGSHLFRVNPDTGAVEDLGATGIPKGTYGASFYDASGYYYVSNNSSGKIYQIDTTNPAALSETNPVNAALEFAQGPKSGLNDGTRCMNAPTPTPIDDSDGDKVPDDSDDYPLDADKAFRNNAAGSLAFEDQWPMEDDFDFNDVVVDYKVNQISNAENNVVEIEAAFSFRAAGAAYANAFAIELPFSPKVVESVTGADVNYAGEWSYLKFNDNNTEAGQSKAVVFISDDIGRTLGYLVNTDPNGNSKTASTVEVVIKLAEPQPIAGLSAPYNPFLVTNLDSLVLSGFETPRERGVEVHLANMRPTDLADMSLLGTGDDKSDSASSRYYMTGDNLPWALHIPESFDYPIERAGIVEGYPKFAEWAASGGDVYADWYQNKKGYRVSDFIY